MNINNFKKNYESYMNKEIMRHLTEKETKEKCVKNKK